MLIGNAGKSSRWWWECELEGDGGCSNRLVRERQHHHFPPCTAMLRVRGERGRKCKCYSDDHVQVEDAEWRLQCEGESERARRGARKSTSAFLTRRAATGSTPPAASLYWYPSAPIPGFWPLTPGTCFHL